MDGAWRLGHRHKPVVLTCAFFAGTASFSGSRGSRSCAFKLLATDSGHMVSCLKEMLDTEGTGEQQGIFFERPKTVGQLWVEVSCASLCQLGHMAWTLVKGRRIISSYQLPSNHTSLTVTGANHLQWGRYWPAMEFGLTSSCIQRCCAQKASSGEWCSQAKWKAKEWAEAFK